MSHDASRGEQPEPRGSAPGLAARLRAGTRAEHLAAERSGIMRAILVDGRLTRERYAALLRGLHAIYAALEAELARHAAHPALAPLRDPALARAARLAADLVVHHGPGWPALPPAPAAADYARHLHDLGARAPERLVAHAYVRYLGDLSGGQLLPARVAAAAGVPPDEGFSFYAFPGVADAGAYKQRFRAALDALPLDAAQSDAVVDEARDAFARHVVLFEQLAAPGDALGAPRSALPAPPTAPARPPRG